MSDTILPIPDVENKFSKNQTEQYSTMQKHDA